jgi:hypothetical protein
MQKDYRIINKLIWAHYFIEPIDYFPTRNNLMAKKIREHILYSTWYKIYHFFEFVFENLGEEGSLFKRREFATYINAKLRQHNSAYTLTNGKFIPITNNKEIEEIKRTQDLSQKYSLTGIQQHLNSSIELLSKKPIPEYRSSIKESISMVEVISRIIEPTENTLGKALNKLDKGGKINGTLKSGFEKMYAYTNDKNGIRHALMDDESVGIEDAKFFLISCSAFTNYLIEKSIKSKIL